MQIREKHDPFHQNLACKCAGDIEIDQTEICHVFRLHLNPKAVMDMAAGVIVAVMDFFALVALLFVVAARANVADCSIGIFWIGLQEDLQTVDNLVHDQSW